MDFGHGAEIYSGQENDHKLWKTEEPTRSVNKVMRLIQYKSVLTFKLQIEFVPFKIVPLGGYTPPETLFPLFVATLVVANRNRFCRSVTAFSMFSTVPKWRPLR